MDGMIFAAMAASLSPDGGAQRQRKVGESTGSADAESSNLRTLHTSTNASCPPKYSNVSADVPGRYKEREERARQAWESFGKPGRDPQTVGSMFNVIATQRRLDPT